MPAAFTADTILHTAVVMTMTCDDPTSGSLSPASRLRDFLHVCAVSAACEEVDRLREAVVVLGVDSAIGAAVEARLACGAPESAVLALIGPDRPFLISRGASGACLATVIHGAGMDEAASEGATIALALCAAHVASLLAELEQNGQVRAPPASGGTLARLH